MPETATFVAVSCVHVPHHVPAVWNWFLNYISDLQPTHIILLGDLFDSSAVSIHPNDTTHPLEDEYFQAAQLLSEVRETSPHSKLVWTLGNHDDNIISPDPRRTSRSLRSLLHWNKHWEWGAEFRKWQQIPYSKSPKGVYRLGPVRFYHGFRAGSNSDELETLEMRAALNDQAHSLYIRGHTHRPTPHITQCKKTQGILLPWHYANVGTMGTLSPEYMRKKSSDRWGHALVQGECSLSSPRRPSPRDWDATMEHYGD